MGGWGWWCLVAEHFPFFGGWGWWAGVGVGVVEIKLVAELTGASGVIIVEGTAEEEGRATKTLSTRFQTNYYLFFQCICYSCFLGSKI